MMTEGVSDMEIALNYAHLWVHIFRKHCLYCRPSGKNKGGRPRRNVN